jgi:hypothetical protein
MLDPSDVSLHNNEPIKRRGVGFYEYESSDEDVRFYERHQRSK